LEKESKRGGGGEGKKGGGGGGEKGLEKCALTRRYWGKRRAVGRAYSNSVEAGEGDIIGG